MGSARRCRGPHHSVSVSPRGSFMALVQFALRNFHFILVIALLFVVAGLVSLIQIPVDILPQSKSPGVVVVTFYNGMPASAIDRNITTRMERWCVQATGVLKVESKSMVGVSIVRLYFRDDIDPAASLVELNVVVDQSVYVRNAIDSLVHEGILGALLAAGMILIFLGDFRSTVIATLSIPLAVLAAITTLLATGNTINAMTLGGLALAVGPLVDNAIVVLENTHRHLVMGKSPARAAADGAGEVAQPAVVATLSTIIVLVPLALMPGMGKFLFRPLALAVAF